MTIKELEALDGQDNLAVAAKEGQLLRELVRTHKPKVLLEVGTAHGYSAAWMKSGMSPTARLMTIDRELMTLIDSKWDRVEFLQGTLQDHIEMLPSAIDFVFLDSDHQIQNITADIELLEPKLSRNAVVMVHDTVYCEEMGRCLEDYFRGIDSERLKNVGVLPSKNKWKYEALQTQYGLGMAIKMGKGKL